MVATPWLMAALDVAVVALLAGVLVVLRRDVVASWRAREAKLRAVLGDLRTQVATADRIARDLDRVLADREERLRAAIVEASRLSRADAPDGAPIDHAGRGLRRPPAPAADGSAESATRARVLLRGGAAAADVARQVGLPLAEVRVLAALERGGNDGPAISAGAAVAA
jgi:hypothetical protein